MSDNEVEFAVKTLKIDDALPAEIEALKAAGWELIPGVIPVAVYHVVRKIIRQEDAADMQLRMQIDDSKIGILRNGKMVGE